MSVEIPNDLEDAMGQLISDSSRPSKFDSVTMNVATELAIAQFAAEPLQKIRHILEAYFFLDPENRKRVISDPRKDGILRKYHALTLSFAAMYDVPPDYWHNYPRSAIPWNFGTNEAAAYFRLFLHTFNKNASWTSSDFHYYQSRMEGDEANELARSWRQLYKRLENGDSAAWVWYYQEVARETWSGANASVCRNMKVSFEVAVMDEMVQLSNSILKMFVNGEVWEEALALAKGGGGAKGSAAAGRASTAGD